MAMSKGAFKGNSESFPESGDSSLFVINSAGEVFGFLYGELAARSRAIEFA